MAKELPYFKFIVSEWLNGSITLEDYETQGLFINICAYYWNKEGDITITEIKRRLKDMKPTAFDSLIKTGIISSNKNDKLTIKFLDEQLTERKGVSQINSQNGKLGGRPKKIEPLVLLEEKPTALISGTETIPEKSNIEIEEDKKRKEKEYEDRKLKFAHSLEPFKDTYPRQLLTDFYKYWTEPNKSKTKFKQEMEKTWDTSRRLETWASRDKSFNGKKETEMHSDNYITVKAEQ
jgi:hypothetical protein